MLHRSLKTSLIGLVIPVTVATACGRADRPATTGSSSAALHSEAAAPQSSTNAADSAVAPQTSADADAPSEEAIEKVLTPWRGDLDGMIDRRVVRMLVTFSKTNYFLDGPRQRGATYEAGKLFEDFLNAQVKSKLPNKNILVHVMFIPVSRGRLFKDLEEGKGDLAAANLTVTPSRQKSADFSPALLTDVSEVVVSAADQPEMTMPEDLSGRSVHVRRTSSYFESLQRLNKTLRESGKAPVKIVEAPEALEDEDLLEMVNAGVMPNTVVDDDLANLWRKIFKQIRVQKLIVNSGGEIAWAIRKNTPQLHQMVSAFVRAHPKGSKNYNLIFQKYFQNAEFIRNATDESGLLKFQNVREFFLKYGHQYDLPWLLLAAQGYQESQLDQSRRSQVGAVGVMQIKPSTAEGSPIFIKGVESSAEKNIQAGAKYLKFVMDEYYKDEPMDRVNKGLFAMASYNAGPARISRLRKKAAEIGLDPNRWFANVEVVAARDIGRETVTYVSNIYKYYVSYNLMVQQREVRRRARGSG
jgi:membrane-bound lytic murein transglycosylase MltF